MTRAAGFLVVVAVLAAGWVSAKEATINKITDMAMAQQIAQHPILGTLFASPARSVGREAVRETIDQFNWAKQAPPSLTCWC
jgi:hypothetical protein